MAINKITTFQKRLRKALDSCGMSQSDLADKLGRNKSRISHYLKNVTPKDDVVEKIAAILNVNELWLLGYDCEPWRVVWDGNDQAQPQQPDHVAVLSKDEQAIIEKCCKDDKLKTRLMYFAKMLLELSKEDGNA